MALRLPRHRQVGQVIEVYVSSWRDTKAAHRFFEQAIGTTKIAPTQVTTDQAPVYPAVLEDLLPVAWHRTDRYANNRAECDHGRLKARLRPMRGLNQDRSASVIIAGHAFVQNLRRGHYELAVEEPTTGEWRSHSTNWSWQSDPSRCWPSACPGSAQRNSAAWAGSGAAPGQLGLLDWWSASGQAIRPIGAVSVDGALGRSSGLAAKPTIWPRLLMSVATVMLAPGLPEHPE